MYGSDTESENNDMEVMIEAFEKLNKEEIDVIAANIRKISPKFAELKRPVTRPGMSESARVSDEYEEEVKRIALLPENSSLVMSPSEEEKTLPSTEPNTAPDRSLNAILNEIQHSGSSREVEVEMEESAPSSERQSMAKFPISPKQQEGGKSYNSSRQTNFLNWLVEGDSNLEP